MIPLSAYILAASVAVSGAAGFYAGHHWATGSCDAEKVAQARDEAVARIAGAAAAASAAEAISRIEVKHVHNRQVLEREVRTSTVYADCRATPDGVRRINAALTGADEAPAAGSVPAASAPGG